MAISRPFRTGSFDSNFERDFNFNYLYPHLELPTGSEVAEQLCDLYTGHYGIEKVTHSVKRTIFILLGNLVSNYNLDSELMTAVMLSRNSKPYHEFLGPTEKFNQAAMKKMVHCLEYYGIIDVHTGFNMDRSRPTLLSFCGYSKLKETLIQYEVRTQFRRETQSIVLKNSEGIKIPYKQFSKSDQNKFNWAPQLSEAHFHLLSNNDVRNGEGRSLHATPLQWIYADDFTSHGRSYFNLQGMSQKSRNLITINGEESCELDFVSNGAAIMYAMLGIQLEGDAYTLGNPRGRKLAKMCFTIMCNTSSRSSAIWTTYLQLKEDAPEEVMPFSKFNGDRYDYREYVEETSEARLRNKALHRCIKITVGMLEEKHENLLVDSPYGFYKKNSLLLMRIDSEVSTKITSEFVGKGEVIIPIHDGFRVRKSLKEELRSVMISSYKSVVGDKFTIQIEED